MMKSWDNIAALYAAPFGISPAEFQRGEYDLVQVASFLQSSLFDNFEQCGRDMAYQLFLLMVQYVPAYQQFLKDQGVSVQEISSASDVAKLPVMTKSNYIQRYSVSDRCWGGNHDATVCISSSSGSSGMPSYWPRNLYDEQRTTLYHALAIQELLQKNRGGRTLIVVTFALGIYIGGIYTTTLLSRLRDHGYEFTYITPGIVKEDIVQSVAALASDFDQIIFFGYPPFVKDVIEELVMNELCDFSSTQVDVVLASESFHGNLIEYLAELLSRDIFDIGLVDLYACSDMGVIGFSTPAALIAQRSLDAERDLRSALFHDPGRSTLHQYNPAALFIEEGKERLLFSVCSQVPLLRYDLGDAGGVLSSSQIQSGLPLRAQQDFDMTLRQRWSRSLPFVFLQGRSGLGITYYGVNLEVPLVKSFCESLDTKQFTGRFVMYKTETDDLEPCIHLSLEHQLHVDTLPMPEDVVRAFTLFLARESREFSKLFSSLDDGPCIRIDYEPEGSAPHFLIRGVKHHYIVSDHE